MMKLLPIFLGLAIISIIGGCARKSTSSSTNSELTTYTGTFESKKGVMDEISCYCYNSGFLTTENGERIAVCFKDENANINCTKIEIKGEFETVKITPENTNPCPAGEMKIFMVKEFVCK